LICFSDRSHLERADLGKISGGQSSKFFFAGVFASS